MSTYNGDKYIKEQIESILCQKDMDINIIIRDDGSTDNTVNIIKNYIANYDNIELIEGKNFGCEESFNQLCFYALENKTTDFYAFCDQDDIWMPNKITRAVTMLNNFNEASPNLYFSNLSLVTENLEPIRNIYKNDDVGDYKQQSLIQIFTYGCTCVFNRVALDYYCKPKNNHCRHDHWIYIICALLGNVIYDKNSYILYRQHSDNVSGAKKEGIGLLFQRFLKLSKGLKGNTFENLAIQLIENFKNQLNFEDRKLVFLLSSYRNNLGAKLKLLFSKKYRSNNRFKNICIVGRILFNHL